MTARASCCVARQLLIAALAQARCAVLSLHRHSLGLGWTLRLEKVTDRYRPHSLSDLSENELLWTSDKLQTKNKTTNSSTPRHFAQQYFVVP
jgi:hypothetical protein